MTAPSNKKVYQLYCGVDIAARNFTASIAHPDHLPAKASSFEQAAQGFENLKKLLLSTQTTPDQILFTPEQRAHHPVRVLCAVLKVSESGYYAWSKRVPNQRCEQADQLLAEQVETVFEQSRQTYGRRRVHAALRRSGISCSRRRLARLMRQKGLISCWRLKKCKICTTDSQHNQPVVPNRLNRDFTVTAPNQKWVGDITVVLPEEGWLYLSALVDIYSRTVVGWAMDAVRDEQLVENALWMALVRRKPAAGLLHHSDRGSPYTSRAYRSVLEYYSIELSMSRKANCWDNSLMESFFGTLKVECTDRYNFKTRREAKTVIFEYMEIFYNRQRLHSSLDYISPEDFERIFASPTP